MISKILEYFNLNKRVASAKFKDIANAEAEAGAAIEAEKKSRAEADRDFIASINTPPKKILKKFKETSLTISFKDGRILSWTITMSPDDNDFVWRDFYTWYVSKDSPLYVFVDKEDTNIFKRENIVNVVFSKPKIV